MPPVGSDKGLVEGGFYFFEKGIILLGVFFLTQNAGRVGGEFYAAGKIGRAHDFLGRVGLDGEPVAIAGSRANEVFAVLF